MINKTFVSSVCMLSGRTGLKRGASRARRWPARRGTGRGTVGREILVLSALQAWSGVLFVQLVAVQRGSMPLVMRWFAGQARGSVPGRWASFLICFRPSGRM